MFNAHRTPEEEAAAIREHHEDEYRSGLDDVPTARQERKREEVDDGPDDGMVAAARMGCAGALGELL